MHRILSRQTVSISELKKNPAAVIEAADGEAVAILVHNRPSAYISACSIVSRMPSSPPLSAAVRPSAP